MDVDLSKCEQNQGRGRQDIVRNMRAFVEKTLVMNQGNHDLVTPEEPHVNSMRPSNNQI